MTDPIDLEPTLAPRPSAPRASEPGQLPRGATIGRYVVLEAVGQGAMGAVYAAYDPQLDRKVALKLLSARFLSFPLASERLVREARSLARLAHPNVVAVHDVGTVDAQVFIAMQFVDGRTLKAELAERRPGWHQTLQLLLQAGRGLAAAHRAGLVHRDFKPDNVLVGRDGRVQVTDFGLARDLGHDVTDPRTPVVPPLAAALDGTLTATGEILGTPLYMSPEQLEGKPLDHRADQFSFCVTAYEALHGVRPFAAASFARLGDAVRRGAPPPPPKSPVPPKVHAAIARGLATDPDQRFPSMEALLAALEVVPARPGRRLLWAAALGLTVATAAGVVVLGSRAPECPDPTPMLEGTWSPAIERGLHEAFTATQSPLAEDAFGGTRALLERQARHWVAMHREACEATRVQHVQSEVDWSLRHACLERRRTELEALVQSLAKLDAPMVERATLAAARLTPVEVCGDVSLLKNLQQVPESPELRPKVAELHRKLASAGAEMLTRVGLPKETLAALAKEAESLGFEPAIAEVRLLEGKDAAERSQWPVAKAPLFDALLAAQRSGNTLLAVEALVLLVDVEQQTGHLDLAHQWSDLANASLEPRSGREPHLEARLLLSRAGLARREQHFDEAIALATEARDRFLALEGESSEWLAATYSAMAGNYDDRGEHAKALPLDQHAVAIRRALLGPNHPRVLAQRTNLAVTLRRMGRYDEARAEVLDVIARAEALGELGKPRLPPALVVLGQVERARGKLDLAVPPLERAVAIQRGLGRPTALASALTNLGNVMLDLERFDEAAAAYQQALEAYATPYPNGGLLVARVEVNLAEVERAQGKFAQALARTEKAAAVLLAQPDPSNENAFVLGMSRGQLELELGHATKALQILESMVAISNAPHTHVSPLHGAELRWAMVRALSAAKADPRRLKAEARELDAALAKLGDSPPKWLEQAKAWRAAHKL